MNLLIETPKHHDLIYDVGMHKGEDTEFYLQKGFRVIGFEANPELVSHCTNRFKSYLDSGQLVIVEGAIVDPKLENVKKVRFYKNDEESVWGTACPDWAERNARVGTSSTVIEVDAVNFGEILQEYGVPRYMKIDIEGCDSVCVDALKGFQECPDYLSIESDKTSIDRIRKEVRSLNELGYDSFMAVEQSAIPDCQIPPRPPNEGEFVAQKFEAGSTGLFGAELSGEWKSASAVVRQYRAILLGYYLLGDDGLMNKWKFRGAARMRLLFARLIRLFTKNAVPGWYDTHARHSSAK